MAAKRNRKRSSSKGSSRDRRMARARAAREARQSVHFERALRERFEGLFGDSVPLEQSVESLLSWEETLMPVGISGLYERESSIERARTVLAAALEVAPEHPAALSLAADIAARVDGDPAAAVAHLQAIPEAVRAAHPLRYADHLVSAGERLAAAPILDAHLRDHPGDFDAEAIRAVLLERLAGEPDGADATAILARFGDRSAIDRLARGMLRYGAAVPEVGDDIAAATAEWMGRVSETAAAEVIGDLRGLAVEHAWIVGGEDEEAEGAEEAPGPLERFTHAESTSPEDAELAHRWLDTLTYGLWQVRTTAPSPGVWLVDLCTGIEHYAAIPESQFAGTARWTVLLGALVNLDGVWRTTTTVIPLSPREADELADLAREMLFELVSQLSGKRVGRPERPERPAPVGVLIDDYELAAPEVSDFQSKVIGAGLPTLIDLVAEMRSAGPRLANTDGDPLVLIEATLATPDPAGALAALSEHPDFEPADGVDAEEGGAVARTGAGGGPAAAPGLTWYGRELDAMERETSRATLEAELRQRGESTELTEPDGPRRWIRGTVAPADGALCLSVNSEERLERFCALLDRLDIPFEISRRDVIDPSLDMAPIRAGAIGAGSPPPEVAAAWLTSWPDEPVPALGGLTPRQAAASDRERPYLEALLRDFEHAGDHERARGGSPADIGVLRETLGMP